MQYFEPTSNYKKYLILELLSNTSNITQRDIKKYVGGSLSMINKHLAEYEENGYIERKYTSKKKVDYILTPLGIEKMRVYNIRYLSETQQLYNKAKIEINKFINLIISKGHNKVILYGAGDVAEIIMQTLNHDNKIPLTVVSIVDDDKRKQGTYLGNVLISDISNVNISEHDCIIISSYINYKVMITNLQNIKYAEDKIEYFFK